MKVITNRRRGRLCKPLALIALITSMSLASVELRADTDNFTVPFTDVNPNNIFFTSIAAAYFLGLTNGTSASTFSPQDPVPREQMAAFITRTLDQSLRRRSRRAAAKQWWTSSVVSATDLGTTVFPRGIVWDGADLWVTSSVSNTVKRVRASDGKMLETWTNANAASAIIAAAGRIFITGALGSQIANKIYVINPAATPGPVTVFQDNLAPGVNPIDITFDGVNLWTANVGATGFAPSITRIHAATAATNTFTAGFTNPADVLWDGTNLWVADETALKRVGKDNGAVLESIPLASSLRQLLFDGANLWVSNFASDSITVVRATGPLRGTVLAMLTGNGLDRPNGMAFDGERILVTNGQGNSVSLFKATDLTPLGTVSIGADSQPNYACSDGLNFWITRYGLGDIVRL